MSRRGFNLKHWVFSQGAESRYLNPSLLLAVMFFPGVVAKPAEKLGGAALPLDRGLYFEVVGSWELPRNGACRDIVVREGKAYIAAGEAGLLVVDVSDPGNMALLGSYDTDGDAQQVRLKGDLALLTDGASGLHIFDVSESSKLQRIGGVVGKGQMRQMVVSDRAAYVSDEDHDGQDDLVVVDLSRPTEPVITHRLTDAFGNYLDLLGEYLVTSGSLLQLDNPAVPMLVGPWLNEFRGNQGYGDTSFATNGQLGIVGRFTGVPGFGRTSPDLIEIYDVSVLDSPVLLGSDRLYIGDEVREIHFWGDYLVVAGKLVSSDAFGPSLYLFNISNPSDPKLEAITYRTGATTLSLTEDYIYTGGEVGINEWQEPELIRALTIQFLTIELKRTNDENLSLVMKGPAGESVKIFESTDMQDWKPAFSRRFSEEGELIVRDIRPELDTRYFKVVLDVW